jgi:hypothetical protein
VYTSNNTAQKGDGGGLFLAIFHPTYLNNVTMQANNALGNGGGLSGHSRCIVANSLFEKNSGSFGGGAVIAYHSSQVVNTRFEYDHQRRSTAMMQ